MPKKRILIAFLLVGLGILAIGTTAFWSSEPTWRGRTLSAWLDDFDADKVEKREGAAEAIRHIGSNAVPFLVPRLLSTNYGPVTPWSGPGARLRQLLCKQRMVKIRPPPDRSPRHQAFAAIDALGLEAEAALPALEKLLRESPPDPRTPYILTRIGPAGVPLLTQGLTNDERFIRMAAGICLAGLKSASDPLFHPTGTNLFGYDRRTCEFNLRMLTAAAQEYRHRHPELELPANVTHTPPPRLLPGEKLP